MSPNLFTETAKGRVVRNILLAILIMLVLTFAGAAGLGTVVGLPITIYLGITGQELRLSGDYGLLLNLYALAGIYLAFFFWVKHQEKRPFSSLGFFKRRMAKEVGLGWLIGALMFSAIIGILALLGMVEVTKLNFSPSNLGVCFLFVIGWQIQSGSEELATRGWLLPVIATHHRKVTAIAVSSFLFGALHLFNPNVAALSFINICLFGLFMTLYVIWKGDIWGVCAIHASWNCFQGSVFGISVSGQSALTTSLIGLNLKGNNLLTGGAFGVEGSLLTSVLLILSCAFVYYKLKKAPTNLLADEPSFTNKA